MAEKKILRLELVPQTALLRFAWNGGGELPASLSGYFTSTVAAKQALAQHNATQKEPIQLEDRVSPQPKKERR